MKIVVGSLQQETNTLSPIMTKYCDFDVVYGKDMLERINVIDVFKEAGAEIIPTIYANALPSGMVIKKDFERFCEEIVSRIPDSLVDGIWLYLHGAMFVDGIGSGEEYLVRRIREKIGDQIPIALALDFHANNTDGLMELSNIICGYQTAPHTDMIQTEIRAAKLLVSCIESKILPIPQMERCNIILPGDMVITSQEPLKSIMDEAHRIENEGDFLSVNVFNGQPWVDAVQTGPSIVAIHKYDKKAAKQAAARLAKMLYDVRHQFHFLLEACDPREAVNRALMGDDDLIFITDSGDNTTAGATGDNAFMLKLLIEFKAQNVLIGGITDKPAVDKCFKAEVGELVDLDIGASLDIRSIHTSLQGILLYKGDITGWYGDSAGRAAVLISNGITVIITERRTALIRPAIFESVNINIFKFKVVVVKLGYLYPDLAKLGKRAILAFTPGASTENLIDMGHQHIRRPMYPLDDNFM